MIFLIVISLTLFILILVVNYKDSKNYKPSREKIILLLKNVLNGINSTLEWDEFICVPIKHDPILEDIRNKCLDLEVGKFVRGSQDGYKFNELGLKEVQKIIDILVSKSEK